jgi:hypothetical protein
VNGFVEAEDIFCTRDLATAVFLHPGKRHFPLVSQDQVGRLPDQDFDHFPLAGHTGERMKRPAGTKIGSLGGECPFLDSTESLRTDGHDDGFQSLDLGGPGQRGNGADKPFPQRQKVPQPEFVDIEIDDQTTFENHCRLRREIEIEVPPLFENNAGIASGILLAGRGFDQEPLGKNRNGDILSFGQVDGGFLA